MAESCTNCGTPLAADDSLGFCTHCLSLVLTAPEDLAGPGADEFENTRTADVGGYEILELIAAGGMASVYRARHESLGRVVALKMAHPGLLTSKGTLERFQIEAEAVAALDHPNVVQIFGSGVQDGRPYLAMEFLAGGTLADRFEEFSLASPGLTTGEFKARVERTLTMLLKVTRAVQHAHERAILHRDLKPSNVLLEPGGEPKVGDFGLAKQMGKDQDLTLSNAVLGTPDYMAPEIARQGAKAASVACDVYSLGVILYHLLTGATPFHSETTLETMRRAAEEEARTPSILNLRVPGDLAVICLKCLAKEPARRYAGAGALADDLERFLTHRPIVARPVPAREKFVMWCRRHPRRVAGLAALLFSLVAGTCGMTWQWWQTVRANHALVESEARLSRELRLATALRLASQARNELTESPPRALLLATEAVRTAGDSEARQAALTALMATLNETGGWPFLGPDPQAGPASLSPDGRWLARLDETGHADLRSMDQEGLEHRWAAHPGAGHGLGWLAARMLCTAGNNGELKLWRVAENGGAELIASTNTGEALGKMAVIPQTRQVAILGVSGALRLWPVTTKGFGESLLVGEFSQPGQLAVNGDGTRFVVTHDGRVASLVTLGFSTNGRPAMTQVRLRRHVTGACFSPDGRWVATGGTDNQAWLYDLAANEDNPPGFRFGELTGDIRALAFSPDSRWAACVGNSEVMMLWKLGQPSSSPAVPVRIGGFRNYAVAFSPDSTTVFSGGSDHLIYRFDLGSLEASPTVSVLRGFETPVWEILVPVTGNALVGITGDGSARRWNLAQPSGAVFAGSPVLPGPVRDVHYTEDGKWLAAATDEGNIYGWRSDGDLSSPWVLHGHQAQVCSLAFGGGGRWLISGSCDGTVRWWDWEARVEGRTNEADRVLVEAPKGDQVRAVTVHPGDARVVAAGGEGWVWMVATNTGATPESFQVAGVHEVRTLNFSSDGRWLAIGGLTAGGSVLEIRDFNTPTAAPWRRLLLSGNIETAAFSRNNRWVAAGGDARTVSLWDLSGTNSTPVPGHAPFTTGAIGKLAFSPDGRTLAIADWDSSVRLWQFQDPAAETPLFRQTLEVRACAFSPDGRRLATGGVNRRVTVWDLDPDVLVARARAIAGRALTPEECARFPMGPVPR